MDLGMAVQAAHKPGGAAAGLRYNQKFNHPICLSQDANSEMARARFSTFSSGDTILIFS
jgi:hypothetical protein